MKIVQAWGQVSERSGQVVKFLRFVTAYQIKRYEK